MIKAARIKFDKLKGETPKAYLIQVGNQEHWIPKSLCRKFTTNKKLGGHVELPTFIINRMFDTDINQSELYHNFITPTWEVIHHTPEKVTPVENNTIERLKK